VVTFVLFCSLSTISGEKIISILQASDTDTTLQAIGRLQGTVGIGVNAKRQAAELSLCSNNTINIKTLRT
jgi:spore maturation protein SpmB